MATAAVLPARDIPTTLNYYQRTGDEAPFIYTYELPKDTPKTNIGNDPHPVVVHDARGKESELTLDTSGFQFVKNKTTLEREDFDNDEKIISVYYKEVEELLKKEAGAKRVFIFDHTIRRKPEFEAALGKLYRGPAVSA